MKNESIPADTILFQSSEDSGKCFVETKNLDGETNLKKMTVPKDLNDLIQKKGIEYLKNNSVKLRFEPPNSLLYIFKGSI